MQFRLAICPIKFLQASLVTSLLTGNGYSPVRYKCRGIFVFSHFLNKNTPSLQLTGYSPFQLNWKRTSTSRSKMLKVISLLSIWYVSCIHILAIRLNQILGSSLENLGNQIWCADYGCVGRVSRSSSQRIEKKLSTRVFVRDGRWAAEFGSSRSVSGSGSSHWPWP